MESARYIMKTVSQLLIGNIFWGSSILPFYHYSIITITILLTIMLSCNDNGKTFALQEELVKQLTTQIADLERFVTFLQGLLHLKLS